MNQEEQCKKGAEGKTMTSRELFPLAGKVAIGAAGVAVVSSTALAIGCGDETETTAAGSTDSMSSMDHGWPWPYEKLDAAESATLAYNNWYEKFCCYAVTSAILAPLQDKIGMPYTHFPIEATKWGHGGAVGWGTLCGTLTGAGIATGLIIAVIIVVAIVFSQLLTQAARRRGVVL